MRICPTDVLTRPSPARGFALLGALLLFAAPAAAQQCLGLAPTARTRAAFTQEASRNNRATVDRSRLTLSLSRAMALTASSVRTTYLDTQGMPWEASGPALQFTIEGPSQDSVAQRLCPTLEVSGLRSNVANWGTPQQWQMTRFAPGVAVGWERTLGPDFALIPFASGAVVIENFETLQPAPARETRSYIVLEIGTSIVLYKVLALRFALPMPLGRAAGYPAPYRMRTASASVVWSR
jgi:hypothetical protein